METPPSVNDAVPQIVEETGEVVSERVQRTAEHTEGVLQIAEETVEIEMPVPQVSEQIVHVPEDVDFEILGYEETIRHYQGHTAPSMTSKTNKEKLQHFDKMQTDLRERLARASRGSLLERRELQDALDGQEDFIRHHHQDVQTSKGSLAFAMREIEEKRELVQQFKRRASMTTVHLDDVSWTVYEMAPPGVRGGIQT